MNKLLSLTALLFLAGPTLLTCGVEDSSEGLTGGSTDDLTKEQARNRAAAAQFTAEQAVKTKNFSSYQQTRTKRRAKEAAKRKQTYERERELELEKGKKLEEERERERELELELELEQAAEREKLATQKSQIDRDRSGSAPLKQNLDPFQGALQVVHRARAQQNENPANREQAEQAEQIRLAGDQATELFYELDRKLGRKRLREMFRAACWELKQKLAPELGPKRAPEEEDYYISQNMFFEMAHKLTKQAELEAEAEAARAREELEAGVARAREEREEAEVARARAREEREELEAEAARAQEERELPEDRKQQIEREQADQAIVKYPELGKLGRKRVCEIFHETRWEIERRLGQKLALADYPHTLSLTLAHDELEAAAVHERIEQQFAERKERARRKLAAQQAAGRRAKRIERKEPAVVERIEQQFSEEKERARRELAAQQAAGRRAKRIERARDTFLYREN